MKRQLAVVSVLTALSQLAAFFKLWFTARIFGVGSELDGYNLALVTPVFISSVIAGVLQTGFFPVRARVNTQSNAQYTEAFERAVLLTIACIGVLLTGLTIMASGWLADVMTLPSQPAVRAAFLMAMPYAATLIALNMICDCIGYILAMRGRFYYAAGAPILNGLLSGLLLAMWPEGGLYNLVLGTVLGTTAQLTICLYGLSKSGFSLLGTWRVNASISQLGEIVRLGGWVLPGVFFSNFVVALPPVWATSFGEGAVSAFGYAYRLHTSAVQLIVMATSTIILARFSDLVATGQTHAVRQLLRRSAQLSFAIGVVAIIIVSALGEPFLLWIFGGRFDSDAASRVTLLWMWLTVGLGFTLLGNVFAKLWLAQSRPGLMSSMAAVSLLVLYAVYLTLRGLMDEKVIAIALSSAALASCCLAAIYWVKQSNSQRNLEPSRDYS